MTAYLICFVEDIHDRDEIELYRQKSQNTDRENVEPLVVYGRQLVMEGPDFEGVAMLKFPDLDAAKAWYDSPAYQDALAHRVKGARSRLVLVEGVDASVFAKG